MRLCRFYWSAALPQRVSRSRSWGDIFHDEKRPERENDSLVFHGCNQIKCKEVYDSARSGSLAGNLRMDNSQSITLSTISTR